MKIIVTGGAGFIGRSLVSALRKNHTVTIYDNLENSSEGKIKSLIESGASFVKGDVLDYGRLEQSCKGFDVMIHLAAKTDVVQSVKKPDDTIRVNVNGTINAAKSCIANNIKKIVFASSAAVYGNCENTPIKETADTKPISPYGKSKLAAESEIKKIAENTALQYIILRIFNVYGKGQNENYSGVITKFAKNISENEPLVIFGDGMQTRDFVSIRDVVNSFEKAIVSDKTGTYNIASGKKTSVNQLAKTMMEMSGKSPGIIYDSKKDGDIENSFADTTAAKEKIGFVASDTLEDGLAKII